MKLLLKTIDDIIDEIDCLQDARKAKEPDSSLVTAKAYLKSAKRHLGEYSFTLNREKMEEEVKKLDKAG